MKQKSCKTIRKHNNFVITEKRKFDEIDTNKRRYLTDII